MRDTPPRPVLRERPDDAVDRVEEVLDRGNILNLEVEGDDQYLARAGPNLRQPNALMIPDGLMHTV